MTSKKKKILFSKIYVILFYNLLAPNQYISDSYRYETNYIYTLDNLFILNLKKKNQNVIQVLTSHEKLL